jgi:hypothetical protein
LHPLVRGVEVPHPQEQTDASGELTPDRGGLLVTVGAREHDPGLRSRRADYDPTLRTPVVRQRRRILDELEAECSDEESDRPVVVVDHDRHVLQVHAVKLLPQRGTLGSNPISRVTGVVGRSPARRP